MMNHHGENPDRDEMMKLFRQQQQGVAKRQYPNGRLNGSDDGALVYVVEGDKDKGIVRVDFGKHVTWLGLEPKDAIALAQSLIKQARSVSKEPLTVVLH